MLATGGPRIISTQTTRTKFCAFLSRSLIGYACLRVCLSRSAFQIRSHSPKDSTSYTEHFLLNATIPELALFVPLAVVHDMDFVELGTVATILGIFAYLCRVFIVAARRMNWQECEEKRE